jgi:hypothetical protein
MRAATGHQDSVGQTDIRQPQTPLKDHSVVFALVISLGKGKSGLELTES